MCKNMTAFSSHFVFIHCMFCVNVIFCFFNSLLHFYTFHSSCAGLQWTFCQILYKLFKILQFKCLYSFIIFECFLTVEKADVDN